MRFIRLTWVDLSNTTRFRIIPIQHFVRILASNRPAISMIAGAPIAVFNAPPSIEGISGERIYTPDLSSLRPAAYAPGHATVFGWFESKEEQSGPIGICPRGLLKRTLRCVDHLSVVGPC
jgi:glutamine synthetase